MTFEPASGKYEGGIKFEIESGDSRVKALIKDMTFNEKSNQIDVETEKDILFLELYKDNGELLFMVPVGTSSMNIGISSYPKGVYFMKMLLEGEDEFITTKVIKDF